MADLYLDHNVAVDVGTYLRFSGHTVRLARDLGQQNAGDHEVLATAARSGWILVTHNIRDYELLHDAWRSWSAMWGISTRHGGILAMEPGTDERRLAALVDELLRSGCNAGGELYVWRRRHGWLQRP